jgi:class 3 adenylate cyclase
VTATTALETVHGAVVFTDLVGFTEFTAERGDAEAFELVTRQEAIVRAALPPAPEARLVKELGDGLLLWFAHARSAVCTSVELQTAFEAEATVTDLPLWVRIGLHWGRQAVRGDDVIGHDVNVAARIMRLAGPGEVLLSQETLTEAGRDLPSVRFDELGPVVIRGIPDPIRLWRAQAA